MHSLFTTKQDNPSTPGPDSGTEVWTLSQVADFLKISEKSVTRLLQQKQIPGVKVGGQWRFLRQAVEDWFASRMSATEEDDKEPLITAIESQDTAIPVSRLLSPDNILPELKPGPKEVVLRRLCRLLQEEGAVSSGEALLEKVMARERMASTALPGGLALPHPREPDAPFILKPSLALGICPKGTEFGAPDGQPTHVFFLICVNSLVTHVRLLGRLSLLLRTEGLLEGIQRARDAQEIHSMIIQRDLQATMGV